MLLILLLGFVLNTFALHETCRLINELFTSSSSSKLLRVESMFECINSFKLEKKTKDTIIEYMSHIMEGYAFKDILKNPPQPSQYQDYYE